MKAKIALVVAIATTILSVSVAEARYRGDRGFRHRRVIVEQQVPTLGLGIGALLLLSQLGQPQQYEPAYEQPAPRRRAVEPKLRDNPVPLK